MPEPDSAGARQYSEVLMIFKNLFIWGQEGAGTGGGAEEERET